MTISEGRGLIAKVIVDGYHVRKGFFDRTKRWPTSMEIAEIVDCITDSFGLLAYEQAGFGVFGSSWVFCDAVISDEDAIRAKAAEDGGSKLSYDLDRLLKAKSQLLTCRATESTQSMSEFVLRNLEIGRSSYVVYPPRQTGVDTIISSELLAAAAANYGMVMLISKDGGFEYSLDKIREMGKGTNIVCGFDKTNGHSKTLMNASDLSFFFNENGDISEIIHGDMSKMHPQSISVTNLSNREI